MPVGGGETANDVSGWTVDTVNARVDGIERTLNSRIDHMEQEIFRRLAEKDLRDEQRFRAQQDAFRSELAGLARAVDKAEDANEKRFESVNEFRAQLGDQARQFLPRLEYDRAHTDLVERVDQMRQTHGTHLGDLDKKVAENTAGRAGGDKVWAYVLGAVGLVVGLIAIITRFV